MAMTGVTNTDSGDDPLKDSTSFETVVPPPKVPLKGLAFGSEFQYAASANEKRKTAA